MNILLVFHDLPESQVLFRILERGLQLIRDGLRFKGSLIACPGCSYPSLAPGIVIKPGDIALEVGYQLDTTSAIANDRDFLPFGIKFRVPMGSMSQNTFVFRYPRIFRELPRIESPDGREHKVHLVMDDGSRGNVRD